MPDLSIGLWHVQLFISVGVGPMRQKKRRGLKNEILSVKLCIIYAISKFLWWNETISQSAPSVLKPGIREPIVLCANHWTTVTQKIGEISWVWRIYSYKNYLKTMKLRNYLQLAHWMSTVQSNQRPLCDPGSLLETGNYRRFSTKNLMDSTQGKQTHSHRKKIKQELVLFRLLLPILTQDFGCFFLLCGRLALGVDGPGDWCKLSQIFNKKFDRFDTGKTNTHRKKNQMRSCVISCFTSYVNTRFWFFFLTLWALSPRGWWSGRLV